MENNKKEMEQRHIHNVVAGLVTGPLENALRGELLVHFGILSKASEVTSAAFSDARRAMEDRILHADMKDGERAIRVARDSLIRIIDAYVPAGRQVILKGCIHEQYAGERTYTERFKKLYRGAEDQDVIFLEYSDHVDSVREPLDSEWSTDELDAFSFDELAEVVTSLEHGDYELSTTNPE